MEYSVFSSFFQTTLFSSILSVFIIAIFARFILSFFKTNKKSSLPLPPGPKRLPIIGNLHQLSSEPHKSIEDLARKHGPIMFLQMGSVQTLVVSSADVAKEIFKNHDLNFSGKPTQLYVGKKMSYDFSSISFAPYGEYWREVRKIAILELLSLKRVKSFQSVRDEEMGEMIDLIKNTASESVPVDLSKLAILLSNNTVSRIVFGKKFNSIGSSKSKFDHVLHNVQALLGDLCISDYFPYLKWVNKFNGLERDVEKTFGELDKIYDEVIEEHRDPTRVKLENEDLVDVLLGIQKDPHQAIALSDVQIKGVLTDLFNAGSDTSASSVVWTMTQLMRNQSAMKTAQNEVRTALRGKKRVEEDDLSKLSYLKLVIKESLRLHPPVPFLVPRETMEECVVRGYRIPAKTRVLTVTKSIGSDPKYWEHPNEFRPERFLNSSVDYKGHNFELIPFGTGRRGCPGINFGVVIVELVIANLLYRFDWSLGEGMTRKDLDLEEAFGLTMFKKNPLRLIATPVEF